MVPTLKGANVILYSYIIQIPARENRYLRVASAKPMKTIVLDFGNTSLKMGLFEKKELKWSKREAMLSIDSLIEFLSEYTFDAIALASTGVSLSPYVQGLSARWKTMEITNATPVPLTISYDTPDTLGVDRIAAAVAANAKYPNENTLVIDCGTCVTYELIQRGTYCGGAISPGLKMRLAAMNHFTQRLPLVDETNEAPLWPGKSTNQSMLAGAIKGWELEIKGFIDHQRHQSEQLNVILTGGDAHRFESTEKMGIFADPFHVLRGLNEIFGYNADTL